MNEEAELDVELVANVGRGYVPAERNVDMTLGPQFIPMDSIFSPSDVALSKWRKPA